MGESRPGIGRLRRFIRGLAALAAGTPLMAGSRSALEPRADCPLETGSAEETTSFGTLPSLATEALPPEPRLLDEVAAATMAPPGDELTGDPPSPASDEIEAPPAPPDPDFELGLLQIRRCQWGRAQRALEEAVRRDQTGEAQSYLSELRAVRRHQRLLERWPRDSSLHMELGRLYFGLELGDEALHEFRRAVQIEPGLARGHFYMAVEHLFRGEDEAARAECERANELDSTIPTFTALERMLATGDTEASEQPPQLPTAANA